MDEKRKYPRFSTCSPVTFDAAGKKPIQGRVTNISRGGMYVEINQGDMLPATLKARIDLLGLNGEPEVEGILWGAARVLRRTDSGMAAELVIEKILGYDRLGKIFG